VRLKTAAKVTENGFRLIALFGVGNLFFVRIFFVLQSRIFAPFFAVLQQALINI
jgi:hypothetical protein